jgi:hypothetical protein
MPSYHHYVTKFQLHVQVDVWHIERSMLRSCERKFEHVSLSFIHVLCQLQLHALRSVELEFDIYENKLLHLRLYDLPPYVGIITHMMKELVTLVLRYMFKYISHHPYTNDKVEEFNDIHD